MNESWTQKGAAADGVRGLSRFAGVDAWVFDLDNTLYPRDANLFMQVDERIRDYVQRLFNLEPDDAHRLQKDYYRRYGTTLRGLMVEHGLSPDDFLDYVHDIDHSPVVPDPALAAALARLPGRRFIMTNGSRRHAEKVAERLGIAGQFEDIFDIVSFNLLPKPGPEAYDRLIAATGIEPARTAMFEDLARNLVVPHERGMATVLVTPRGLTRASYEDWELAGSDGSQIDFVTDDLGGFLEKVLAALAPKD